MIALRTGLMLAWSRTRGRWALVALAVSLTLVVGVALVEHRVDAYGAADRSLLGVLFGLCLPLLVYAVVGRALDGRALPAAVTELARYGVDRRRATVGALLGVTGVMGVVGGVLGALCVVAARGSLDGAAVGDALTSAWIGVLAGASYTWLFAVAGLLGTAGRVSALIADWLLGSTGTFAAVVWPRGHLLNLLGAEAPLDMPQWSAALSLGGLAFAYGFVAIWRTPK